MIMFNTVANEFSSRGYSYIGDYIESSNGLTYFTMEWEQYYIMVKFNIAQSKVCSDIDIYCDNKIVDRYYIEDEINEVLNKLNSKLQFQ